MEQYLFHNERRTPDARIISRKIFHTHEFWQADHILAGTGSLFWQAEDGVERELPFSPGYTAVIPRGVPHRFVYCESVNHWLSVKFASDSRGDRALGFLQDSMLEHAMRIILEALSPHFMSRSASLAVVNAALGVIVGRFVLELSEQDPASSEFVRRIREYVYSRQGGDVRLEEIGEVLHCTGKHASLRFRRETGQSLKQYLDRTRADFCARLLRTSDRSLTELAAQLEFRDLYAFSRFFRRTMHESLSAYRGKKFDPR